MVKSTPKAAGRSKKPVPAKKAVKKAVKKPAKKAAKKAVKKPAQKATKKAVKTPVKKTARKAVRKPATKGMKKAASKTASYPAVLDPTLVGTYPADAAAGGGYVWDAVLEYRVWCHPEDGSDDYYCPFESYNDALAFSKASENAEEPLALILQKEYIDEPEPGCFVHIRKRREAEWPVRFLSRPRRTPRTIPDFIAPDAPTNRLDIIRGLAKRNSGKGKAGKGKAGA